jgi:Tfp pilus assembly protein PilP
VLCEASWAVCERVPLPPKSASEAIMLDPPGSFGPFDRTVTLDCLSYVGYKKDKKGEPVATIKDETGKIYDAKRLEPMGMDRGAYIGAITPTRITIESVVPDGEGNWKTGEPIYIPRIRRK